MKKHSQEYNKHHLWFFLKKDLQISMDGLVWAPLEYEIEYKSAPVFCFLIKNILYNRIKKGDHEEA